MTNTKKKTHVLQRIILFKKFTNDNRMQIRFPICSFHFKVDDNSEDTSQHRNIILIMVRYKNRNIQRRQIIQQ